MANKSDGERRISLLLVELHVYGFAIIKEIIDIRKLAKTGTMECPLCGQDLRYRVANNNHLSVACKRKGCLKAMQ